MKEKNLSCEFDAQVWTKEWMRIIKENPSIPLDEATMLGWFANAIMAGYDHAKNDGRIVELQSIIAQQSETIKALKEDGERLSNNGEGYFTDGDCDFCGSPETHRPDCPITLHTDLMKKIEREG